MNLEGSDPKYPFVTDPQREFSEPVETGYELWVNIILASRLHPVINNQNIAKQEKKMK